MAQDIKLLNMLENAKRRASGQAAIVAETKAQHDHAVKNSMISTAKRLRTALARQEMALALTTEEIRECERALSAQADLVTQASENGKKKN